MTIEQVLIKHMKSFGDLPRGRGIIDSDLGRWILGMAFLQKICTDLESYCDVTSATSEQHVEMKPSRITRDDEDVEKLSRWLSDHPPFPETDMIM